MYNSSSVASLAQTAPPRVKNRRSKALLVLSFVLTLILFSLATRATSAQDCVGGACVSTIARGAPLNPLDSNRHNAMLGALLGKGSALTLNATQYNAMLNGSVALGDLLDQLQVDLGLATPEAVLAASISLPELLNALDAISGGANIGINALQPLLAGSAGDIVLGDLLTLETSPDSLAGTRLNLLELVTGAIQLFNSNKTSLPDPVTVNGIDIGVQDAGTIQITAKVLEAPVIACGAEGSTFTSAHVRVVHEMTLVGVSATVENRTLADGLTGDLTATFTHLNVYVDVTSGTGTIDAINPVTPSVTISATPGIASLYFGSVEAQEFFGPNFDPATDLHPATMGTLAGTVFDGATPVANVTGTFTLRTQAKGTSEAQSHVFDGPFPEIFTFSASGSSELLLFTNLVANREGMYDPVVTPTSETSLPAELTTTLRSAYAALVDPFVSDLVLTELVDPLLKVAGTGLGEMNVVVRGASGDGIFWVCYPNLSIAKSHSGNFTVGAPGVYTIVVNNAAGVGATTGPITVNDNLPPGLTFVSMSGAGWARVGTGTAPLVFTHAGPLAPGASLTLLLTVQPTAAGTVTNTATVATIGEVVSSTANNSASDATLVQVAGTPNEADHDGDGVPTAVECPTAGSCPDSDGDGTPDYLDPDDDGDGIYTIIECTTPAACKDSDGDGTPDYLDPDDDGDGIYTIIECATPAACQNSDSDARVDYLDPDDDGDGLTTKNECPAGRTSAASPACPDADGDGIPNYLDPYFNGPDSGNDDDSDGIPNGMECPNGPPCPDTNGDGTPDHESWDDDGDGVPSGVECPAPGACRDTDGDGTPDYRDPDDDGDGIYTKVECPSGGRDNVPCRDTDGDSLPDYLDDNDDDDDWDTLTECPAGRTAMSDPECPALANKNVPDYLNSEFARFGGGVFAPLILRNP